jgi:hypothetical protein
MVNVIIVGEEIKVSDMLGQTKEQVQLLINKIEVLDFITRSVGGLTTEKNRTISETQAELAVTHKLKLTDEVLRLLGSKE